jgi:nuclear pore complex protein Nup98-Nup96
MRGTIIGQGDLFTLSPRLGHKSSQHGDKDNLLTSLNTSGFGTPQASTGFGAKPAGFGTPASTAGTSLFGSNTATAGTGFGGFGSTNTNTSSPFGSNNNTAGGGLFGAKPAFGAATSTPSFGGSTTNTGFGASAGFGGAGGALGGSTESQGTGAVPFAPTVEKEPNSTTNQQNSFQSICFQQPYQKFSPEELRLADYAQGRKTGNGSAGATGAFGQTNFGGFGSTATTGGFGSGSGTTGGGLFGSTTPATGAFGSQPATGAFGSGTTGGGLFGAKPATSGLFGSTPAAQPSGGLFGNTAATTGFGSTPTNTGAFGSTGTTGGLFGTNNSAQKPFSFGNTPQPAASTGGFGSTPSTTGAFGGGGLFGNNTQTQQNTPSAFGTNTTAGNTGGGGLFGSSGFGNNAAQQQNTGSSLFGNQPKPATGGLFGASPAPASGGLFGNSQSTNTNPFGGAQTGASGGLFGGAKPATGATGGLFGGTTAANTGGGLFGGSFGSNANQNQQNTGSSLFGNSSNNQAKPSLFSGSTQNQGGLFGSGTTTGLFGSSLNNNNATQQQQQQPQQPSIFGGSAFGGSQQGGNQSQSLTASINDPAAFGTSSMFSNLASPEIHNPGPIATPLSSLSKQKKPGVLPMYKLNPASASRFTTPQKRGFGFSYSTYGTPGSASSTSSTPLNFGGSMLGSSLSRGLSKSMSTSSLRGSYNSSSFNREDSILAPGAFSASPGSRFNSTGSMKKLVINRSIRTDLFSPPPKDSSPAPVATSERGILKKRVSFDTTTVGGNTNGSILSGTSSPLKQVQSSTNPAPEDAGFLRSSRTNGNGSKSNGASLQPEMEQVKGNELAIVPEEEAAAPAPKVRAKTVNQEDQEPGRYWMRPSREEILAMNRIQRSKVSNFMVGREGVGQVEFSVPVDLNNINLDEIYGKIVILETRQATVYPDPSKKPPMGKGLNVPSRIQLQNSWPRGKDKRQPTSEKVGPRFQKHIERLSRVPDTKFVDYNKDTGVWTFTVEHFTTYGLEYDEDETDGEGISEFDQSTLSAPPDTPTPQSRTPKSRHLDQSFVSNSEMSVVTESDPDDTFDFKKHKVILPGAFDNQEVFEQDAEMDDEYESEHQSFLDERSVGSQSENEVEEPMDDDDVFNDRELVRIEDIEMAGSYPNPDGTAEHEDEYSQGENDRESMPETPGAAMRARMRAMKSSGTPSKRKLQLEDDGWTETLQRTISPRKQDRAELKRLRDSVMLGDTDEPAPVPRNRVVSDGRGFATSIDLMHSLFGETKSPIKSPAKIAKLPAKANGFEVGFPLCI